LLKNPICNFEKRQKQNNKKMFFCIFWRVEKKIIDRYYLYIWKKNKKREHRRFGRNCTISLKKRGIIIIKKQVVKINKNIIFILSSIFIHHH